MELLNEVYLLSAGVISTSKEGMSIGTNKPIVVYLINESSYFPMYLKGWVTWKFGIDVFVREMLNTSLQVVTGILNDNLTTLISHLYCQRGVTA